MDESDPAAKQTAGEYFWRGAEIACDPEDVVASWVRPPAASYLLAGDELGDVGNGTVGRLE
jgi:hypothetical protein